MNDTTMFFVNNFGSMVLVFWAFLSLMFIGFLYVIIKDNKLYNKKVRVFILNKNNKFVCYDTRGGIVHDKKGVETFKTKIFGEDNLRIEQSLPNRERFYLKQERLFNMPFLPYILRECVDFMNVKEKVFTTITLSLITLKRGKELNVCSNDECEFCKNNIDINEFRADPENIKFKMIKKHDVCERCFTEYIDARYEGIDSADLSAYWSRIETYNKRFGDWFNKYGVIVVSLACLILVGFVTYFIFKYSGPMFSEVNGAKISAESSMIAQQINAQQYNNTLPIN